MIIINEKLSIVNLLDSEKLNFNLTSHNLKYFEISTFYLLIDKFDDYVIISSF